MENCTHEYVTSTRELGWHCCDCNVRLLSLSMPIPMPLIEQAFQALLSPAAPLAAKP